jgi:hypothetical protein
VNEKLLENWLDTASERSYQAVFVQMLAAQGYTVVHSTRHCALEYGKDVLAVAPDGVGCAYQLKGNPSGRLTLDAFRREIQPQLVQLIAQPPSCPGFPASNYRAYLVSNGGFDEEVQVAVAQMNSGPYLAKVELISRGTLFEWAKQLGASLWPSELEDESSLLKLYLSDPKDVLPLRTFASVIYPALGLHTELPTEISSADLERRCSSAAVLTGVATSRFADASNHLACATAWAFMYVSLIAAVDARNARWSASLLRTLELADKAIWDSLTSLWREVEQSRWLVEGHVLSDPEVHGWRSTTLLGCLSSLHMAAERDPVLLSTEEMGRLKAWLCSDIPKPKIWGEGAVGSLAAWLLFLRKHNPTQRPDYEIATLLAAVVQSNQSGSTEALASPYFGIYDVLEGEIESRFFGLRVTKPIQHEVFAGSAFTAEALMSLLIRTGRKSACQAIWPAFTRLAHRSFVRERPWHYCLLRSRAGREVTRIVPPSGKWSEQRSSAVADRSADFPAPLRDRPDIHTLWWQVAPHRFQENAAKHVANRYLPGWGT